MLPSFRPIAAALGGLLFCLGASAGELKIHVINVGCGESVLLEGPNGTTMLIDTGKGDRARSMVIPYLTRTITKLDYLVVSHNHDDHGGGAADVAKAFPPSVSYYNGSDINTTAAFMQNWFAAYGSLGKPAPVGIGLGQVIQLGDGATATCLGVNGRLLHQDAVIAKLREKNPAYVFPTATNNNDTSIVLLVKYKGFDYLYTGDLGGHDWNGQVDFETPIITSVLLSDLPTVKTPQGGIDVLQVGHHGSKTSTNPEFVKQCGPEVGVVSVGPNQNYGLPNKEAIDDTLLALGVKVLQTDEGVIGDTRMTRTGWVVGHVMITTDGSTYHVDADPAGINTTTQATVSEYATAKLPWNMLADGAPAADTTAPTIGATVTGTSGTITFSATATDNVGGSGIAKVEFLVDGILKNTLTASPYTLAFDSKTLTNATHTFVAKATDGAGNVASSTAVSFTVKNTVADTTAPTVSASVTGTSGAITFSATATDNTGGSGVAKIEFLVDGIVKGTRTATPYTLAFDSKTLTNATHSLVARATDVAGNVANSTAVSFTVKNPVPDTTAPTVSASVTGTSGTITFSATATDNTGGSGVAKVEFLVDGAVKGTLTAAPYTLSFDSKPLTNAPHSLMARATDVAGNVASSTAVSFTVNNPAATTVCTEIEPNDSLGCANLVKATDAKIVGYFPATTDNDDWFAVTVPAGRTLSVSMTGPTASGQDYDLYLTSSTGLVLASSEGMGTTESVSYRNSSTSTKTYHLHLTRITSYSRVTPYTLTLTR